MDNIREYRPEDYGDLETWFSMWGHAVPPSRAFPSTGFIVPGVAAGFLYTTNSPVVFIENYVSNPTAEKKDRANALDEITKSLLELAKKLGYEIFHISVRNQSVIHRAKRFGFKEIGDFTAMVRGV